MFTTGRSQLASLPAVLRRRHESASSEPRTHLTSTSLVRGHFHSDIEDARRWEPKRLRLRLFSIAGRITRHAAAQTQPCETE